MIGTISPQKIEQFLRKHQETITSKVVPATVAGILGVQTAMDINHSAPEDKKNILINNIGIGAAMLSAGLLSYRYTKNFITLKKPSPSVKEFLEGASIPISAGIAGGVAGEITQRFFPAKTKKIRKLPDFANLNLLYSTDSSFSTIVGYSIGSEKGVKNKIKRFVFEIVSGTLVPLAAAVPANRALNKIFPKNHKSLKLAIILGLSMGLSTVGRSVARWINRKATDKIVENQIWKKLANYQQELLKKSLLTHNQLEKEELIEKVKELTKTIKEISNPREMTTDNFSNKL